MQVSSASGNPKKAYRLMTAIETSNFEELAIDHGMDSLFQKLRYELQRTIKGQFLKELFHEDEVLSKKSPPVTVGGRQLAWMLRRKFDVGLTEQNISSEREFHELILQKDNVPAYLLSLDSLLLEVDICDEKLEVLFEANGEERSDG